ncbi:hypothetical protein [Streptomyces sp. NPDC002573]|uniref:hypothetical protein n=1 Tax=Streptomyces sp. NPDC002573 TaxID=3364651 RepID=UPI0036BB4616
MAGSPTEPSGDTLRLRGLPIRRPTPKPIFVDTSGGRRRRLRILVAALVTPAVAYVALLASTLLGGPTLPALLPHPILPDPTPKPGAGVFATHAPGTSRARTSPTAAAADTAQRHRSPSRAITVSKASVGASAKAKSPSTATPSPTAKPSPSLKSSPSPKPSESHKPFPHPRRTPTATPSVLPTHGARELA